MEDNHRNNTVRHFKLINLSVFLYTRFYKDKIRSIAYSHILYLSYAMKITEKRIKVSMENQNENL